MHVKHFSFLKRNKKEKAFAFNGFFVILKCFGWDFQLHACETLLIFKKGKKKTVAFNQFCAKVKHFILIWCVIEMKRSNPSLDVFNENISF